MVLPGDPAQREQGVGALLVVLADADQDAAGEGDVGAPGVLQDAQPDGRLLVRRAVVRAAGLGPEPGGGGLQHHPHGGGDRLQPLEVGPAQHPGVEVRQQPGLLQHPDRHGADIGQGVVVAVGVQPLAGLGPAFLGPVAEGEQGLLAAQCRALAGDVEDLVGREVEAVALGTELAGDGDEGAVVAAVPTEPGERDEDLLGVGDHSRSAGRLQAGVADPRGGGGEVAEVLAPGLEQYGRLGGVQGDTLTRTVQSPAHGVAGGGDGSGGLLLILHVLNHTRPDPVGRRDPEGHSGSGATRGGQPADPPGRSGTGRTGV